jgi:DNA polymerase III delta prime subunit
VTGGFFASKTRQAESANDAAQVHREENGNDGKQVKSKRSKLQNEPRECPSGKICKRSSPVELVTTLRESVQETMVAQERSFEQIILSYINHTGQEKDEPLVYRFCGPSGTGKTTMACFVAASMYPRKGSSASDIAELCMQNTDTTKIGEHVVSHTFRKGNSAIAEILQVIKDVNKKLDNLPDGLVVILNDYNLADRHVWAVMSSFIKQENMKKSIVILTDDLTPDTSNEFKSNLDINLTPATPQTEAMDIIVSEIKRVFPSDYHEISGHDTWVPFLPLHLNAIEILIEKVCNNVGQDLNKKIPGYLGRLVCDARSKTQASLKLSQCVLERGARVLNVFREAFQESLAQRDFCPSASKDSWKECVAYGGMPVLSIAFEVIPERPQGEDCSVSSMRGWLSFRLLSDAA